MLEACQLFCQHSWCCAVLRGHKRFRSGAWRLAVAAGLDPATGRRRSLYETVNAPDNRAGAKLADARLAELIAAVESGRAPEPSGGRSEPTVAELAAAWQEVHRPHQDRRSGDWLGWSPKTAKTVGTNPTKPIIWMARPKPRQSHTSACRPSAPRAVTPR
jgi:hypothetical protein